MMIRLLITLAFVVSIASCAQVPQSSVTLSNSIGDDVASMQKAHKAFINFYFDTLEQQANELIDDKYRPSMLRKVIDQDVAKFKKPGKKHESLFNAIQLAFVDNDGLAPVKLEESQSNALAGMKIFYTKIDQQVESQRKILLDPLKQQRQALLSKVDSNYINIIKKNAAITALLNSVIEVHETQQKLFEAAGVEEDVRTTVGSKLVELADTIKKAQENIDDKTATADDIEKAIKALKESLDNN